MMNLEMDWPRTSFGVVADDVQALFVGSDDELRMSGKKLAYQMSDEIETSAKLPLSFKKLVVIGSDNHAKRMAEQAPMLSKAAHRAARNLDIDFAGGRSV